jgi:hypothetical protein
MTVLRGANAAPTSAVRAYVIQLQLIIGDRKLYFRGGLHWDNVCTRFRENQYIWAEV